MTTQLKEKTSRSNPWKSASLCLATALAAPTYAMLTTESIAKLVIANKDATEAELQAIYKTWVMDVWKVALALGAVSLIAGIINITLVAKGGRKWTLIFSSLGILASAAVVAMLAVALTKLGGQS